LKNICRLETRTVTALEIFEPVNDGAGSFAVNVAEGSAEKGRKAEPQHRTQIAVGRAVQNIFLQAPGRLVDHHQGHALLDAAGIHWRALRAAKISVNIGVGLLLFSFRAFFLIFIKAFLIFLSLIAILKKCCWLIIRRKAVLLKQIPQHLCNMGGHINTYLIKQSSGTYRETEV